MRRPAAKLCSVSFESVAFHEKRLRVENNPSADNARDTLMEDSGGNDVQDILTTAERDGVAGVVSALITGDTIESIGKDVDNLSFSFISPLETDNRNILLHDSGLLGSTKV